MSLQLIKAALIRWAVFVPKFLPSSSVWHAVEPSGWRQGQNAPRAVPEAAMRPCKSWQLHKPLDICRHPVETQGGMNHENVSDA